MEPDAYKNLEEANLMIRTAITILKEDRYNEVYRHVLKNVRYARRYWLRRIIESKGKPLLDIFQLFPKV